MSINDIPTASLTSRSQKGTALPPQFGLLIDKMERIASTTNVDMGKNIFTLMQKEQKVRHNFRQDAVTKLRNLENRSEMNRASVELMNQRRPKKYSLKSARDNDNNEQKGYLKIYKQLKEEKAFPEHPGYEQYSEDESEVNAKGPPGIKNYKYLKDHPKIVRFALEKKKNKDIFLQYKNRKEEEQQSFRESSRPSKLNHSQFFEVKDRPGIGKSSFSVYSSLIENQLSKFYSKNRKGRVDQMVKQNPRCSQIMRRQERIVSLAEENQVSQQNLKKLKGRMNQIVNELSRNDRRGGDAFPQITSNTSFLDKGPKH